MGPKQITFLGCGLIGGSMAMAVKRRRPDTTIVCLDTPEALPGLRDAQIADVAGTLDDLLVYAPDSDLIVLASPVKVILEQLEILAPLAKPGTVITDVGSTKTEIVNKAWSALPPGVHFIGGHPIAGSQHSGVQSADPLLFNQRVWILCPSPDTPADCLLMLIGLVEDLLAVPVTMEAEEHDRLLATLSHMPQLLAVALMHAALQVDQTHGMVELIAGPGFLDLTRIAASDYPLWEGILDTNRDAVRGAFDLLEKSLAAVRTAYQNRELADLWTKVSDRRKLMTPESLPRARRPELRKLIDRFDEQIVKALGNRMRIARKIGKDKANQDAPVHDPDRERRLLAERLDWARSCDLPPDLIRDLFEVIMNHSKKLQAPGAEKKG